MSRSTSVEAPALRRKVDVARAVLDLRSDGAFAKAIGIEPSTLAGYFGAKTGRPDHVPHASLEAMSELVASQGHLSIDQARAAWLGDFDNFFLALAHGMGGAFEAMLGAPSERFELALSLCALGLGAIEEDVLAPPEGLIPAGARFQLAARAWPSAYFVALVRSSLGWQIAAPRQRRAVRFGPDGLLRAPDAPLRFSKDGGEHVFVGFAILASAPPSLIARATLATPLSDIERDRFAVELTDTQRVKRFALAELRVMVARG